MRRGLIVLLWGLCTCGSPERSTDTTDQALIQDAAHGGRAGFYFLPPLVPATPLPPVFDPSLTLVARLDGPSGLVATFPLAVKPARRLYEGVLDTRGLGLDPAKVYRVRVLSGPLELGFADVRVFTNQHQARSLATDQDFELVEDHKLKIEVYVNQCAVSGCPAPTGSLEVTASVDEVDATGAFLGLEGEAEIAQATVFPAAPGELAGYWPPAGTPGLTLTVAGVVGAWAPRSREAACAPLAITEAHGSGHPAFADMVAESRAVSGAEVCVSLLDGAGTLELRLWREGLATTPTLAALGRRLRFESRFRARLPEPVFDGERLDLGLLDGTRGPLPLAGALRVDERVIWYQAELEGTLTLAFLPTGD